MIDLFTKPALEQLREVANRKPLVAFDFDGTLAPIVPYPELAAMRPMTHDRLAAVSRLYPTVVISGRGRADVKRRLSGITLRAIVGNHGMEPRPGMNRPLALGWHAMLTHKVGAIEGVHIENKGLTLAVHYRHAKDKLATRKAILRVAASIPEVRIVEGKQVVNLLPENAPDKGGALLTLCQRFLCSSAIFIGDDDNDEPVFTLSTINIRLLGIRVGFSRRSQARYYLQNQRAVDKLLTHLLAFAT